MVKIPEAEARRFKGKFVCRICKSTISTSMMRILAGKVKCRNCKSTALRLKRKK